MEKRRVIKTVIIETIKELNIKRWKLKSLNNSMYELKSMFKSDVKSIERSSGFKIKLC